MCCPAHFALWFRTLVREHALQFEVQGLRLFEFGHSGKTYPDLQLALLVTTHPSKNDFCRSRGVLIMQFFFSGIAPSKDHHVP